ncbi:hypothetical protein SAMN05660971_03161 [Halomonas cupida]|uniref:Uncharacterized protein n=1 Tax=Halomonas cupida TaxID=44933 RepID=A0A1M7JHF6_9GAMM|nr:hypothetical protein SAMN05660971_03161 [Halomonas cupida]
MTGLTKRCVFYGTLPCSQAHVEICLLGPGVSGSQLRATSYELRATSYELRATSSMVPPHGSQTTPATCGELPSANLMITRLGSGFGVRGSGFGVRGSGFGVRGSGFGSSVACSQLEARGWVYLLERSVLEARRS